MEKELLPLLQKKLKEMQEVCAARGLFFRVTSTYRSPEAQTALYNQPYDKKDNDGDGRIDEADEKVTNAKAGQSLHNWRVAFDIVPLINGKAIYDETIMGAIAFYAKQIGFEWGGDWATFKDMPHFQITLGYDWPDFQAGRVDYSKFDAPGFISPLTQAPKPTPAAPITPPGDNKKEGISLIERGLELIKKP